MSTNRWMLIASSALLGAAYFFAPLLPEPWSVPAREFAVFVAGMVGVQMPRKAIV